MVYSEILNRAKKGSFSIEEQWTAKQSLAVSRISGTRRGCCSASRTDHRRHTPASTCRRSGICRRAGILNWGRPRSGRPGLHGTPGTVQ
jgi:hypothetical protein